MPNISDHSWSVPILLELTIASVANAQGSASEKARMHRSIGEACGEVSNNGLCRAMLLKDEIDGFERIFLDQFEEDGDQITYRKNGRGAPIPVTEEERENFRLLFRKTITRLILGGALTLVILVVLGFWFVDQLTVEGAGLVVVVFGSGVAACVWFAATLRSYTVPSRALQRRSPIGNALTKEEWQARQFGPASWSLLISMFAISVAAFFVFLMWLDFTDWEHYLWTGMSALISVLGVRALWLKHRYSR